VSVTRALSDFVNAYRKTHPHLDQPFDPDWRSPCEVGEPFPGKDGQRIQWQPTPRDPLTSSADFEPLERALEVPVHPDIKAYYGAFWSGNLEAQAPDGHVSLILLWSPDDVARLTENLIGHALAGRRARAGLSIFFACTEPDSDLFLALNNTTGTVHLEQPGRKPIREISPSLAEFLDTLVPAASPIPD